MKIKRNSYIISSPACARGAGDRVFQDAGLDKAFYISIRLFIFLFLLILFTNFAYATTESLYVFATKEQAQQFAILTENLRCLVCQNETLADSQAPLAFDLRKQIAKMIAQGKSDQAIQDYLVSRYGDFILYQPPFNETTYLLWLLPLILLILGFILLSMLRQKER